MKTKLHLLFVAILFLLNINGNAQWINNQLAEYVVGQTDFTSTAVGCTDRNFYYPHGVAVDFVHNKMYVSDFSRVLRFSYPITGNGMVAEMVFGQPDFTSSSFNNPDTDHGLNKCVHIAIDKDGALWVGDNDNNRLVKYANAWSQTTMGPAADVIISAPAGYSSPQGLCFDDDGTLWVSYFQGIARYNVGNQSTGAIPNLVLACDASYKLAIYGSYLYACGQKSMTTYGYIARYDNFKSKSNGAGPDVILNGGTSCTQNQFRPIKGIDVDNCGNLYATDMQNNRVLIFIEAHNKVSGDNADFVLGQPDFNTASQYSPPTQSSIYNPEDVFFDNARKKLLVVTDDRRVLQYGAIQSSNILFSNVQYTQMDISWTPGAGNGRAVFIKAVDPGSTNPADLTADPVNGTNYTANTNYTSAPVTTNGWHCIYNQNNSGTNSVTVTGLTSNTTYRVMACDYTGSYNYTTITAAGNPDIQITLCRPVVVNATSGLALKDYDLLKNAFDKINDGTHKGAITIAIGGDLTETATCQLNASGGSSSYTSVKIQPNSATERLIKGNIAGSLLSFNGADNVTIDGRYGGSGSYLRFRNISSGNSAISFSNDAKTDTVEYSYIESITNSSVITIGTTSGTDGNDNIVIRNCSIRNSSNGEGNPQNLIYIDGTASKTNDNITISNCELYNFTASAITTRTTSSLVGNNYTIANNHIYNTLGTSAITGISISGGNGHTASDNFVGGQAVNCGGLTWQITSNGNFTGLSLQNQTGTNTVHNNTIKNIAWTGAAVGNLYGIYISNSGTNLVTQNTIKKITNTNTGSTQVWSGIYVSGNQPSTVSDNVVDSISNNFNGQHRGIWLNGTGSATYTVSGNTISNLKAGTTNGANDFSGIYSGGTANYTISNNSIYNLQGTNTTNVVVINGISFSPTGVSTSSITANKIYALSAASSNTSTEISGILMSTEKADVVNNMISMVISDVNQHKYYGIKQSSPTSGSNYFFNSVYIGGTSSAAISCAFICNVAVAVTLKNNILLNNRTGANNYAIYLASTTTYTGDYNDLYSSGSYTGNNGTDRSFSGWQTATGQDALSLNSPVSFSDAANGDLHTASPVLGGSGTPIVSITTDYDGDTRNATVPAIGADEVAAVFPPLTQAALTASYTHPGIIHLAITPGDGNKRAVFAIETTSVTANPVNGTTYTASTLLTGGSALGSTNWHCVYNDNGSSVDVTGLKPEKKYYFIVFEYNGVSGAEKYLTPSNGTDITLAPFVTVTGDAPASTDDYFTLKEAVDRINDGTHQGNVNVFIKNNLSETASCVLNASLAGSANYLTVNIQPGSTANYVVAANLANPLFDLNGADNVTIDGSFGGDNLKHLTFRNTNSAGSTIRYSNDAVNDSNNYVIFEGANLLPATGSGVVILGPTTGSTGNDFITFDNCDIRNCSDGSGNPAVLINCEGTAGKANDNLVVKNSNLFNFTLSAIASITTPAGNNFIFDNNNIYNTLTASNSQGAINLTGGSSHIVKNNYIGGQLAGCAGASWKLAGNGIDFSGILISPSEGNLMVDNNTIKNIEWTSGYGNFSGILVNGSADDSIRNNTVSQISSALNATTGATFLGISTASSASVTISQNTISNMANNIAKSIDPDTESYICGIYINNGTTANIVNNTISNISSAAQGNVYVGGIFIADAGNQVNINHNSINALSATYGIRLGGITMSGNNENHTISNNRIWDITSNNTIPVVFGGVTYLAQIGGITISGGRANVYNNMISLGSTDNLDHDFGAIANQNNSGTASNFYFNSVYIGGNPSAGSNLTSCIVLKNSKADVKNNILYNARSGGSGNHFAFISDANKEFTSDYNNLMNHDTSKIASLNLGLSGIGLNSWQLSNLKDINSMSIIPSFINTDTSNLHITDDCLAAMGISITGFIKDFDDQGRNNPPTIGADEIAGLAKPTIQAKSIVLSNITPDQVKIDWINGDGAFRKVFIKAASAGLANPECGINYTANNIFGTGDQIGTSGWYCVYDGIGTGITITNLSNSGTYRIMVVEYNQNEDAIKYLTSGADDNPVNFERTSGEITVSIDYSEITACEGDIINLGYTVLTGMPTEYQFIFNQTALDAGFQNIAYTGLSTSDKNGIIEFTLPEHLTEGEYTSKLQLRNELGVESELYDVNFKINLSSNIIISKFNDVVLCDNSSKRFVAYQWYKNGEIINGATSQFYNDPNGLVGTYSLKVITTSGETLYTCGKTLNIPLNKNAKLSVYPNPVKSSENFTVEISNLNTEDLQGAVLNIYNPLGVLVYSSDNVKTVNYINLPKGDQYAGVLVTRSGKIYTYKVIVIN